MKKYPALIVLCSLLVIKVFAQPVTVLSPVSNKTYVLPDPAGAQTTTDLQAAITTAETAAKALNNDAESEQAAATNAANDQTKTTTLKNEYIVNINNFNKNDVTPYKQDMDSYNAAGAKYTDLLAKHNKAVLANNALAAKDRKAATVAALNQEKAAIDAQVVQLGKWKDKLDAAKAKLDVKNAALQKQQQKYEALDQASVAKLKASKVKLKGVMDQLIICAAYANKCQDLLRSKFKVDVAPNSGYFNSPEYKNKLVALSASLEKLKSY